MIYKKFPDEIYAVFDIHGDLFMFEDLKQCPVYYGDKGIRVAIYNFSNAQVMKTEIVLEDIWKIEDEEK